MRSVPDFKEGKWRFLVKLTKNDSLSDLYEFVEDHETLATPPIKSPSKS